MSGNRIILLIYHRHKLLDLIREDNLEVSMAKMI
jgi:hypothetical protein